MNSNSAARRFMTACLVFRGFNYITIDSFSPAIRDEPGPTQLVAWRHHLTPTSSVLVVDGTVAPVLVPDAITSGDALAGAG